MPEENKNLGVIEVLPVLGDFIAGAETGIATQVNLGSGDWRPMLPTDERQLLVLPAFRFETNCCVSFSANNELETFIDLIIDTWPADVRQWLKDKGYFDESGRINFSDRFTAVMSGTDPNGGNSLPKVWDSIRHNGLVPESLWPAPIDELSAIENPTLAQLQAIYFKAIPADVIALGKEFAARFNVQYEWVKYPGYGDIDSLRTALRTSPLQIATAVCNGWNTANPIQACGPGTQHGTLLVNVESDGSFDIFDHYNPFEKHFASGYDITYAMRGVIAPQSPSFGHVFAVYMRYGAPAGTEVTWLQKALQTLTKADGTPYMKPGVFGPFGPQTKAALGQFQTDNGITDPEGQGTNFGPQSRAAMNKKLAALTG